MEKKKKYEDIEERVKDYFLMCDAVNDKNEELVKPYTLSGLLCYLGISRKELEKLCSSKKYSSVMQNAISRIEAFIEENALTGELSCNASMNSLKYNFGWGEHREKNEADTSRHITVALSSEMSELAR